MTSRMTPELDATMARLDEAITNLTDLSQDAHEELLNAFAAVARELQWDGFCERSREMRSINEEIRQRARTMRRLS